MYVDKIMQIGTQLGEAALLFFIFASLFFLNISNV